MCEEIYVYEVLRGVFRRQWPPVEALSLSHFGQCFIVDKKVYI